MARKQQAPLTIKCAEIQGDSLEAVDEVMYKVVTIRCCELGANTACSLNEDTARRLFNWLGIWLHKQGDS